MISNQVKLAFKDAGMKVRVADLGLKFRVCLLGELRFDKDAATAVAAALGLTDIFGEPGAQFNSYELIGYKPGAVIKG